MVDLWPDIRLLMLLAVANVSPIVLKRLVGSRCSRPIDGGILCWDGRPVFGASKTWRGVLSSVIGTSVVAPALGMTWELGASIAGWSMAGDLMSSFIKRRLGVSPSGRATGLDQLPEALLPLLVLKCPLGLKGWQMIAIAMIFFVLEVPMAWLFWRLGVRDRPY